MIDDRTTNWTVVPCPTEPWARLVFPDLAPDEALERLWEQVAHVCRLDEPDPVAAWNERADDARRRRRAAQRAALRRAPLRGAGTDLTIGLLPTSTLPRRAGRDGRRDRPPREPARPRRSTRRPTRSGPTGVVALDEAARPRRRDDHPRPRGALRGRARGRDRRRAGRRRDARPGRASTTAPRASARSRSSTARAASAGSAPSSTTRCWTRTPPATSRSATAWTRASRTRRPRPPEPQLDPHRLHDRRRRGRRHRDHARRRAGAGAPRRHLADLDRAGCQRCQGYAAVPRYLPRASTRANSDGDDAPASMRPGGSTTGRSSRGGRGGPRPRIERAIRSGPMIVQWKPSG